MAASAAGRQADHGADLDIDDPDQLKATPNSQWQSDVQSCQLRRPQLWLMTREPAAATLRLIVVKMRSAAAAAVAVSLLAAGCGSLRASERPGTGRNHASPVGQRTAGPTAAGNRRLAARQALRLLALTPVPGGAQLLRSAPPWLPIPAMGTPEVSSLADRTRSWRVAMPFAQAVAWLQAHRPRGLTEDGSVSGNAPYEATMVGYGYSGPVSQAWQSAELEIEIAPAGPWASVMRADGMVVWLDPSPVRDAVPGPRLRVTVAGGCPRTDTGFVGVTNSGSDLASRLVPAAVPSAGLECRYYGLNGHAGQLRSATALNAAQASRVASSMARLPLSHPDGEVRSCPNDDGSVEVIALSYPRRADVDLWIDLTGCGGVSNGYITAG